MKSILKKYLFIVLALLTFQACIDESDCTGEESNLVNIYFYRYPGDLLDTLLLKDITLNNDDSLFLTTTKKFNIQLPLDGTSDSTRVTINRRNGGDSILFTINYDKIPRVISEDCGVEFVYTISGITNLTTIDSVVVDNPVLDEGVEKNISIFRDDCSTVTSNEVKITFYKYPDNGSLDTLLINNVTIKNDDSLYYDIKKKFKITLPLSPTKNSSSIIVSQRDGADSIFFTLNYETSNELISDWCGEEITYYLSSITDTTNIDSVAIIHKSINDNIGNNIEIYRKH